MARAGNSGRKKTGAKKPAARKAVAKSDAKRPETRARKIAEFVGMLERGEKIHP